MPVLGIIASQISGHLFAPSGAYDSIATATSSGSSATISFTSIPQTYTHLQLRMIARSAGTSAGLAIRANTDTGNSYTLHYIDGDGGTASAVGLATGTLAYGLLGYIPQTSSTASTFNGTVVDILDYTNTSKNKTIRSLSGVSTNTSGGDNSIRFSSILWTSTAAITQLDLTINGGGNNFAQYSSFALYGIKGA
jgi:hypothetical protein